jgi:hypothetical protein
MTRSMPFDRDAVERIHQLARGIPRRINLLCDRAMLGAYARGTHRIGREIIAKAAAEVFGRTEPIRRKRAKPHDTGWLAVGLALVAIAALYVGYVLIFDRGGRPSTAAVAASTPASAGSPASAASAASAVATAASAASSGTAALAIASSAPASAAAAKPIERRREAGRRLDAAGLPLRRRGRPHRPAAPRRPGPNRKHPCRTSSMHCDGPMRSASAARCRACMPSNTRHCRATRNRVAVRSRWSGSSSA